MTLTGIKELSIAALAGIASVTTAPACAEGAAVVRIEVGFSAAYQASTYAAQMLASPTGPAVALQLVVSTAAGWSSSASARRRASFFRVAPRGSDRPPRAFA